MEYPFKYSYSANIDKLGCEKKTFLRFKKQIFNLQWPSQIIFEIRKFEMILIKIGVACR